MEFEWDSNKDRINQKTHGVSFVEAMECFADPFGLKLRDKAHSLQEERFYWVGQSNSKRILTTRFTMRGELIRIIGSAEWRKFRKLYYEATKTQ